jgi:uncharacterized protein (TIGR00369 family)
MSEASSTAINADPTVICRVRESFARQSFMATLGARLTRVEAGIVEIELPFRSDLTQQHGFFHAGSTASIADTAGGYAAYSVFPADSTVLTVEFKINLLAPAQGDKLIAIGSVIKSGRTLTITDVKVFSETRGQRTLCAVVQQTLICLIGKADKR